VTSAALLAAALSAAAAQSLPGDGSAVDAIPATRVSRGLEAHPRLQMPRPADIEPMFRVEVQAPRLETVLDAVRRELAANPRGYSDTPLTGAGHDGRPPTPAASVNVLPAIVGLARQLQRARRERSERRIHDEVSAELAAFCDVNDCAAPNEGLLLPGGN
jgi:hypothetical protein